MIVDGVTALPATPSPPRRRVQIHDPDRCWAGGIFELIFVFVGVSEPPRCLDTTGAGGMPLDKSEFGESAQLWICLGVPTLPWTCLTAVAFVRQPVRYVLWVVMLSPVGVVAAECLP